MVGPQAVQCLQGNADRRRDANAGRSQRGGSPGVGDVLRQSPGRRQLQGPPRTRPLHGRRYHAGGGGAPRLRCGRRRSESHCLVCHEDGAFRRRPGSRARPVRSCRARGTATGHTLHGYHLPARTCRALVQGRRGRLSVRYRSGAGLRVRAGAAAGHVRHPLGSRRPAGLLPL